MSKDIITISVASALISYWITIILVFAIAWCFNIEYSIKSATGIWLSMMLLRTTLTTNITK